MVTGPLRLLLVWSARDLRARALQVGAIALIVALGSGFYSGLSSTARWRRSSYDASYATLRMWDVHVALATGSAVPRGALAAAVRRALPGETAAVAERLIGRTQVDASTAGRTILVPGRIVGMPVEPAVARVAAKTGRTLGAADAGRAVAVLDYHFAKYYDLAPDARIRVSGGPLRSVGQGLGPEYLLVIADSGSPLAEANFAVVFTSLETAARLLGEPGRVNDLVLRLRPGADAAAAAARIRTVLAAALPTVGADVTLRADDPAHRFLYRDIDNDQRLYAIFAVLVLAGAAFAAFNLIGRMVEAQRREIGIGMALGVPRRLLAVRPLLVGAEVALLGALLGVGAGLVVDRLVGDLLRSFFPLPVWRTPFQPGLFAQGAALGLAMPVLASLYPVLRAVRVTPMEAIRTGWLAARTRGISPLLGRIPLPGTTIAQLPVRNVLRTPRRSLLTTSGIAASIAILVGSSGMVDSFMHTIDSADREASRTSASRLTVGTELTLASSPRVSAVRSARVVARSETGLELPVALKHGATRVDALLEVVDPRAGIWTPTLSRGRLDTAGPSIVISRKAAHDLGVSVGDLVTLRHPRRTGLTSYTLVDSRIRVGGIDVLPTRAIAFMDVRHAGLMNLDGVVNRIVVVPRPGISTADVQRALFGLPGVTSVQPVSAFTDTIRKSLADRLGFLHVIEGAVLLLALLIAFNSTSISVDERAREHATMFAFGVPVRRALLLAVVESLLTGIAGTLVGIGAGWLLLDWLIHSLVADTLPDIGILTFVSTRTTLIALALGVVAVAAAPLLVLRRLGRMDIPSTLRVVE